MNLNFRKTALLAGICSVFSLGYAPQLFAVSSTDTVEAVQQTKKITGVVSDAMGPIIGANVLEKGTTNGVITDIDGNFALNVKPGATIVVSFIGYVSQEIKITNQTTVNITLKEDSEMLDEVVVVGYGTMKKRLNSTCKCNRILINNLFKFFVWREVSKSFTRSIIEFIFNPLNLFVGYFTKVLTLWDILPDKPVGVFIGTTFP